MAVSDCGFGFVDRCGNAAFEPVRQDRSNDHKDDEQQKQNVDRRSYVDLTVQLT